MKIKMSLALLGTAIMFLMSCGPADMANESELGNSSDVSAKVVDQNANPSDELNFAEQNTDNIWYGGAGYYYRYYPGLLQYFYPYNYSRAHGRYTYYPYFGCLPPAAPPPVGAPPASTCR